VSVESLIVMAGAAGLMVSTVVLVRRRLLSIRYGLGWLTVALAGFLGTPLLNFLASRVHQLGFTDTGFSLGVLIVFLGLICLQLSISLSGLHRAIQDLTEHAALSEQRLRRLESESSGEHAELSTGDASWRS
jgi:Na+/melibiose symporter-like transporter